LELTFKKHGKWGWENTKGILVAYRRCQQNGTITLTTDEWDCSGDPTKDIIGKGLIVHQGTDDFVSQPQVTLVLEWLVQQLSDKQPTIK
jgi:Cu-Zn family superoxide dismutase